jgi:hypothetical protein
MGAAIARRASRSFELQSLLEQSKRPASIDGLVMAGRVAGSATLCRRPTAD